MLTTAAEARGFTGLCIDGGVRDVAALKAVVAAGRARAAAERMMFEELRGGATTLGLLGLDPTSVTGP